MIAVALDLSSSLIGVSVGVIEGKEIKKVMLLPIKPKRADGLLFGFTTKDKKRITLRSGEVIRSFLKEGEVIISKKEAARRNAIVKNEKHNYLLRDIGRQIGGLLVQVNPDVIIIERNESFNGVLTTKLLAEIAGGLYFFAGATGKEIHDYNVSKMRAKLGKLVPKSSFFNENGERIVDTKMIVRERLKCYYAEKGIQVDGIETSSLDETDSLLALVYYAEQLKEEEL